jgi:hypothetical protein
VLSRLPLEVLGFVHETFLRQGTAFRSDFVMVTRWLFSIAALLCLAMSAAAQSGKESPGRVSAGLNEEIGSTLIDSQARPITTNLFGSLHRNYYNPGELWFGSGRPFAFANAFGWVEATPRDFLPEFDAAPTPRAAAATTTARPEEYKLGAPFRQIDYAGGEVSFFYGKSLDGRFDRELKGGYILGEIISGNTQINVGAWYSRDQISR